MTPGFRAGSLEFSALSCSSQLQIHTVCDYSKSGRGKVGDLDTNTRRHGAMRESQAFSINASFKPVLRILQPYVTCAKSARAHQNLLVLFQPKPLLESGSKNLTVTPTQ